MRRRPVAGALDAYGRTDVEAALVECHTAAKHTRGAAVSIVLVDLEQRLLTFGGIGNVEGRLVREGRESLLVPARGIVGVTARRAHPVTLPLGAQWL